ncbi:hypothetical protein FF38_02061 [Lucilia cuprina]|uniref:Uncharacterized protein n=1 Tax=Lucilia cuprina TaxID=7375 RepID=A0A0L0BYD6_LUCCU|nr:hypothetical protein FF38_02061 [Lucilia cuprina]
MKKIYSLVFVFFYNKIYGGIFVSRANFNCYLNKLQIGKYCFLSWIEIEISFLIRVSKAEGYRYLPFLLNLIIYFFNSS